MVKSIFGKYSKVNRQPQKNFGMSAVAQAQLDRIVSRANEQFEEALKVDGVKVHHWAKSEKGRFCSCQNLTKHPSATTEEETNSYKENIKNNQVFKDDATFKVRGGRFGETKNTKDPDFSSRTPKYEVFDEVDDGDLEKVLGLLSQDDESGLFLGGEGVKCGICFGTGYIEGYDLNNGKKYVFDCFSESLSMSGFIIESSNFPHSFIGNAKKTNYVQFANVELPSYFENCWMILIRNNTEIADNLMLEYKAVGTDTFIEFNTDYVNANAGELMSGILRVRPIENSSNKNCEFTHLELVYSFTDWFYGQLPPETPGSSIDRAREVVNTSIVLSAKIHKVGIGDVLYVEKYDKLYKVTDITDFMTTKNEVLGWNNVNIRSLQSYELLSMLRLFYQRKLLKPHHSAIKSEKLLYPLNFKLRR